MNTSITTRVAIVVRNNAVSYFKGVTSIGSLVHAVVDTKEHDYFVFEKPMSKSTQRIAKEVMSEMKVMKQYAGALVDSGMSGSQLQKYLRDYYRNDQIVVQ